MAGHSKWAQIKHKKAATDQKRGALFSKVAREITVAARSGTPDPAMNVRLRASIERARSFGLPKENIERAIERAKGPADTQALEEFLYEALGPEGILMLIEGITDNTNRSIAEIRKILSDHDAKLAQPGAALWNFERRGSFLVKGNGDAEKNDALELLLIDAGARDFFREGDAWRVETLPEETDRVREALTMQGVETNELRYGYMPKTTVAPTDGGRKKVEALIEELEDHPDIQDIYTNSE